MTPWTSPMSYLRPNSPPDHTCVIKCLANTRVSVGVEKKVEKVEKEKKEKVRRKKRK